METVSDKVKMVQLLMPQDLAYTDTATDYIDLRGWNGAAISVMVGDLTGVDTSNYLVPTMQESDTTVGTDFGSATVQTGFSKIDATNEDSITQTCYYTGSKRYIRVLLNYTGTGISAGIVGAVGMVCKPRWSAPATPTTGTAS